MSRILLISPNQQQSADIKFLLHLNGYQVETCETIDEGINRFQIFRELDRSFDLVLVVVDSRLIAELGKFAECPFSDTLIVVHENRTWKQSEKNILAKYPACDPKRVLDSVKHQLRKVKNGTSANEALDVRIGRHDSQPDPKVL